MIFTGQTIFKFSLKIKKSNQTSSLSTNYISAFNYIDNEKNLPIHLLHMKSNFLNINLKCVHMMHTYNIENIPSYTMVLNLERKPPRLGDKGKET